MTTRSDKLILKEIQEYIEKNPGKKDHQAIASALGIKERKVKKLLEKQRSEEKQPIKTVEKKLPRAATEQKLPVKKWVLLCSCLLIILSGFFVYANSMNSKFLWDDEILIQDNKEIQSWSNLPRLFVENIGTGAGRDYNFYRPLHMITIMANYSLGKMDPRGYHLTNILFHILTALCVYALANLLFYNNTLSLITALLWVVHPVHTEVVDYVSGRFDALSAFFMLLCLILYIKNNRSIILTFILVPACSILAILSKENALILPALALLYHYIFGGFKWKKFIPLMTVTVIYIVLRLTVLYFPNPPDQVPTTLLERVPGFFVALTNYVTILMFPFGLHMEHGDMLFKLSDPKAPLGILILASAAFRAFQSRNDDKLMTFSILWFFVCLLPESNLYRINAYMNEHWLYLPSIGFFLILAKYLSILLENSRLKILGLIACIGLLSFFSFLTIQQNNYWKDPITFYERTLKYAPFSSRLLNNLARQYGLIGRNKEAIELFKKSIEINPDYAEAYNNLGVVYANVGRNDDAIDMYKMALKIDPNLVGAYANLGNSLSKAKKHDEAIDLLQKGLKIRPDSSAYNNLAMVYRDTKKYDKAIEALKQALVLDPNNILINFNLGNTYAAMGKALEAIDAYKRVLGLNPNNANAYNNIGFLLKGLGKNDEAISNFNTALKIDPKMPEAYENLILIYLNTGETQKATEVGKKAISADPSHAKIYNKLLRPVQGGIV